MQGINPDVVLLHNTSPSRCDPRLPAVKLLYRHSTAAPAAADRTFFCSKWLADRCGGDSRQVCLQAVPRPLRPQPDGETRSLRADLVVGRICTPIERKWPPELPDFYRNLTQQACRLAHTIRWEFVGCPVRLQPRLQDACGGRAIFHPAAWEARTRLWHWDAMLYHNPRVTESFGRTAGEAMRAGCIPIVDDRGGFREQISPGCGYLCRTEDDFAAAINDLQSPVRRWQMSHACRARADEQFSLKRFGSELLERFREAAT